MVELAVHQRELRGGPPPVQGAVPIRGSAPRADARALPATDPVHHNEGHHPTRQHVQLVERKNLECVPAERICAPDAQHVMYRVGGRIPLHATTPPLVLPAFAPAHEQENFAAAERPADEDNPISTPDALRARLAAIRRDRYAVYSRPQ